MATDPAVVAAMVAAVEAQPDNVALRLHLAGLLLDADDAARALEHCAVALTHEPDRIDALELAARAARAAGDPGRAARYERLVAALAPPSPAEPAPAPPQLAPSAAIPAPVPASEGDVALEHADDIDRFLRDVLGDPDVETPTLTLADVGGLDEVKRRLNTSFLAPMRNPEMRKMFGKSLRGGLLLYGPPGCGKTFLARAVAGELGAHFFAVGLHDVLDMWIGQSERNLHQIFETARRFAPCVLFLDEVDALGMKRSNLAHSAGRNVVVQLLNELDGIREKNEGVFVLAATNQPWDVDPALRRPGRFDRMLLVLPPDEPARRAILTTHLRDRPTAGIDVDRLAARTDGYSGADLRLVCESAAESALEASVAAGNPRPISMTDMERAVAETRPSTRPWFEVARNYAMFSNDSGTYDDLLAYLRRLRMV